MEQIGKSMITDPTTPTLLLEGSLTDLDCIAQDPKHRKESLHTPCLPTGRNPWLEPCTMPSSTPTAEHITKSCTGFLPWSWHM